MKPRAGFSLMELLIVISVAIVLTGLMLPAMSHLREDARSLICASNQRQIALAMFMFSGEHDDDLPYSEPLRWDKQAPQELMAAHQGGDRFQWDGIGLLYQWHYCDHAEIFYCPSHQGEHLFDRYADAWQSFTVQPQVSHDPIYTNFHYCGDVDWETGQRRRLVDGNRMVLVTDGLRTASDFNHRTGLNAVHGDGSVRWHEDGLGVRNILPTDEIMDEQEANRYSRLWGIIEYLAGN